MNTKNTHRHVSAEEMKPIQEGFDKILRENGADLVLVPFIDGEGKISAKAEVFKKIETNDEANTKAEEGGEAGTE